jgi:excisionase family DNA binding protein
MASRVERHAEAQPSREVTAADSVLTVKEVAAELRCSKAHVYNAIGGKISGTTPLPSISIGRRRLIRRRTLEKWKVDNERSAGAPSGMIRSSPEVDAGDA